MLAKLTSAAASPRERGGPGAAENWGAPEVLEPGKVSERSRPFRDLAPIWGDLTTTLLRRTSQRARPSSAGWSSQALDPSEPPGLCSSSLDQTRSDVGGLVDSPAVDAIEEGGSQRGIKRAPLVA